MGEVIRTRRQWLQTATLWPACLALGAARKDFWDSKDPATWSNDEKQVVLGQSPWAREGFVQGGVGKQPEQNPRLRKRREAGRQPAAGERSEEHTSELQSL